MPCSRTRCGTCDVDESTLRTTPRRQKQENVYIVMEQCKGGEVWHRVGERHYSERTVSRGDMHLKGLC